jgi:RNA polymerase sigma-70 factor (ECF subfamily)
MGDIDNFLIEELRNSNSRAFEQIFTTNYLNLCRFAHSIVHDEDSAQNLVQQVFINLWESRKSIGHVERLLPYLTATVRNHCINFLKRENRNLELSDAQLSRQTENTTENQINLNDFEEHLTIALATLPDRCREAFEYSRFYNLTNKEIAQRMNISVKGVEALISRSLKLLRVSLADYLPSSENVKMKNTILFLLIKMVRKDLNSNIG